MRPFSYISMLCESDQILQSHDRILLQDQNFFRHFCFTPCIFIHISFIFCPIPRNHIPCNSRQEMLTFFFTSGYAFSGFRIFYSNQPAPGTLAANPIFCCFSSYLKTWSRRILRSSKWRLIAFPHIHRYCVLQAVPLHVFAFFLLMCHLHNPDLP